MQAKEAKEIALKAKIEKLKENPKFKHCFVLIEKHAKLGEDSCVVFYDKEVKETLEKMGYRVSEGYEVMKKNQMVIYWEDK